MKSIEIDFRIFNYASGKWSGCGGQGLIVSALLRLLGQFFALWPDTPLQGNLRSALKVDEVTKKSPLDVSGRADPLVF